MWRLHGEHQKKFICPPSPVRVETVRFARRELGPGARGKNRGSDMLCGRAFGREPTTAAARGEKWYSGYQSLLVTCYYAGLWSK